MENILVNYGNFLELVNRSSTAFASHCKQVVNLFYIPTFTGDRTVYHDDAITPAFTAPCHSLARFILDRRVSRRDGRVPQKRYLASPDIRYIQKWFAHILEERWHYYHVPYVGHFTLRQVVYHSHFAGVIRQLIRRLLSLSHQMI